MLLDQGFLSHWSWLFVPVVPVPPKAHGMSQCKNYHSAYHYNLSKLFFTSERLKNPQRLTWSKSRVQSDWATLAWRWTRSFSCWKPSSVAEFKKKGRVGQTLQMFPLLLSSSFLELFLILTYFYLFERRCISMETAQLLSFTPSNPTEEEKTKFVPINKDAFFRNDPVVQSQHGLVGCLASKHGMRMEVV